MDNYDYYKLELRLFREMLGTCPDASIYDAHVLKKTQKLIEEANRLVNKTRKAYEKFKGVELPPEKIVQELQGIIRRYQEIVGSRVDIPDDADLLLSYAEKLNLDFEQKFEEGEAKKATCFMRDKTGWPVISSHMILGNLKENLRVIVNNGDKDVMKSKVAAGDVMTLDVKVVEEFIKPSKDIVRDDEGKPKLLERPIRFDIMGKTTSAIAMSEVLPVDTEFTCHLRVRKGSPITLEFLRKLLDFGKNNGVGQWHGSGNKGAYFFRLEPSSNPVAPPKGWS